MGADHRVVKQKKLPRRVGIKREPLCRPSTAKFAFTSLARCAVRA